MRYNRGMLPEAPEKIVERLIAFQGGVREKIIQSRAAAGMHGVSRSGGADTIYRLDTEVEPILEEFFEDWGRETPLVVIAEGLEDEQGREAPVVFPRGSSEEAARLRVIVDPIDGTRGLMYDKRSAWSIAGVAPNRGRQTRLADVEVAVMTELPTSKMGRADVLWAMRGRGAFAKSVDLSSGHETPLEPNPSTARDIDHGFAMIANFFPGTKVLASEVMEHIVRQLMGEADVTRATVFDDQYISTAGQFYELIVGHDRFNADLRPIFYRIQNQAPGLCCHPYDCAAMLIAEEAGVILTDGLGNPLDGPMDVTSGISWAGFANPSLRALIEPVLVEYLRERLAG